MTRTTPEARLAQAHRLVASARLRAVAASIEHAPHVHAQGREILLDHRPDGVQADTEVGVNETVASTRDQTPRNRHLARSQGRAEVLDGVADDFELVHDRTLRLAIGHESDSAFGREGLDVGDRGEDVFEEQPVALAFGV